MSSKSSSRGACFTRGTLTEVRARDGFEPVPASKSTAQYANHKGHLLKQEPLPEDVEDFI